MSSDGLMDDNENDPVRVSAGAQLRLARTKLNLTLRSVCAMTQVLALEQGRSELIVSLRALSDFENDKIVPNIHKLWSLAQAYGKPLGVILTWYEIGPVHSEHRRKENSSS